MAPINKMNVIQKTIILNAQLVSALHRSVAVIQNFSHAFHSCGFLRFKRSFSKLLVQWHIQSRRQLAVYLLSLLWLHLAVYRTYIAIKFVYCYITTIYNMDHTHVGKDLNEL